MTSKVVRTLYRSLYRLGNRFDKSPSSKYLIFRNVLSNETYSNAESVYYAQLLDKVFGKSLFLTPFHMNMSLRQLLHEEFRTSSSTVSISSRIDAGFAAYRKLSAVWRAYQLISGAEEDEKTSSLQDQAVRITKDVQPGTLLCAHPMLYGVFNRAVILILDHSEKGSYGLIINKETDLSLDAGTRNIPQEFLDVFGKQRLHFGGPLARLQYIHTVNDVRGVQIPNCSKVHFVGGEYRPVMTAVLADTQIPRPILFAGYCSWDKGQLDRELEEGHWTPIITDIAPFLSHMENRAIIPDEEVHFSDSDFDSDCSTGSDSDEEIELADEYDSEGDSSDDDEYGSEHYDEGMVPVVHNDSSKMWPYLMSKIAPGFSVRKHPKDVNAWTVESVDWPTF